MNSVPQSLFFLFYIKCFICAGWLAVQNFSEIDAYRPDSWQSIKSECATLIISAYELVAHLILYLFLQITPTYNRFEEIEVDINISINCVTNSKRLRMQFYTEFQCNLPESKYWVSISTRTKWIIANFKKWLECVLELN